MQEVLQNTEEMFSTSSSTATIIIESIVSCYIKEGTKKKILKLYRNLINPKSPTRP